MDLSPRLSVFNCETGVQIFDWHGPTAQHLIECGALDDFDLRHCECFPCSKAFVCHLALVAAASHTLHTRMPPRHHVVSRLLLRHPGEHLNASDVQQLMSLECRDAPLKEIKDCLDDLASWRLIQRIEIDRALVFYDINTRPHDHVYDPDTQRLYDA